MDKNELTAKIKLILENANVHFPGNHSRCADLIVAFLHSTGAVGQPQPPPQAKGKMQLGTANYGDASDPTVMPFGKHKGVKIKELKTQYLEWLDSQEWMHEDKNAELLKNVTAELLTRDQPSRGGFGGYDEDDEYAGYYGDPMDPDDIPF